MTDAAGREMDARIAENVMGWKLINLDTGKHAKGESDYKHAALNDGWAWNGRSTDKYAWQWAPSTNVDDAFEVVSKMSEMGFGFDLKSCLPAKHWYAHFCKIARVTISKSEYGDTVPHAISLAALACVRGRGGESK